MRKFIGLAVLAVALTGCGISAPSSPAARPSGAGVPAASPVAATSSPASSLPDGQAKFVSDARAQLSENGFSNSSPDSQMAAVAVGICQSLEAGGSVSVVAAAIGNAKAENDFDWSAKDLVKVAKRDVCPSVKAPSVTYIVTGSSSASVTYGPAGSDYNGSVPMRVSKPLGDPAYYAINAQLQGGGYIECKIDVDGKVISRASASGGYNIADCEIGQDPITGQWQNDNG
jgi:hypothetical protein